ncbi:transposase/integrase [Candidatus Magnetobacterium bavaricum]|uniref:Transposase/integrase n=1 Tax=Candidatus Magnetobacterium bavaricum TaxID=29290 RepID=A0A0F3GKR4_9BACT|nr:transposase/integrase [Candidatus Magnetobacterium bavaricum]
MRWVNHHKQQEELIPKIKELIIKTTDISNYEYFITKRLRKINNYQELIEKELDIKIGFQKLYRLIKKERLDVYINKPDYESNYKAKEEGHYFKTEGVYDLILLDGCSFDYIEIKHKDKWIKPVVIYFLDAASRYIMAIGVYPSESNESAADVFCKFLSDNVFPYKTIKIRPDNAKAFLNLKRPMHEINKIYSLPNAFMFVDDFSRPGKPLDKVYIESIHRKLHNYEQSIINKYSDKIAEKVKGTKFIGSNHEDVTITRINISIDELNASSVLRKYQIIHNVTYHRCTFENTFLKIQPAKVINNYIKSNITFNISKEDIDEMHRYSYQKEKVSIIKGRIQYKNMRYFVTDIMFKDMKARATAVNDKLLLFEDKDDGLYICDALPLKEYTNTDKVKQKIDNKIKKNETELIIDLFIEYSFTYNTEKLLHLMNEGLTYNIAKDILSKNQIRYLAYNKGFIKFNLFITDFITYMKNTKKEDSHGLHTG